MYYVYLQLPTVRQEVGQPIHTHNDSRGEPWARISSNFIEGVPRDTNITILSD